MSPNGLSKYEKFCKLVNFRIHNAGGGGGGGNETFEPFPKEPTELKASDFKLKLVCIR